MWHQLAGRTRSFRQAGRASVRVVARVSVLLLALVTLIWSGPPAQAIHDDNFFELGGIQAADILGDGNAANGPDWADLFDTQTITQQGTSRVIGVPKAVLPAPVVRAIFLHDDLSTSGLTDTTIFAGTNKNNDLISTWQWDTGNNPPKDDFANVYAAAVIAPFAAGTAANAGDLLFYVGVERLAPNGASHLDIELNQANIGLDKDPPCLTDGAPPEFGTPGPPCEFTGEKQAGDILVVMDFENGGALGFLEVRQWNGTEYVLIIAKAADPATGNAEGCNDANGFPADTVCAFNNGAAIDGGPWTNFDEHGDPIAMLPQNAFTELGINVTALLGQAPCITSIMAKSRSSPSFNSELKDFTKPEPFQLCGISVVKTGDTLSKVTDQVTYTFTITNTGAIPMYKQSIVDTLLGDLTGTAPAACNLLAAGASCNFNVNRTVQAGDPDPLVNTVTVVYDSNAGLNGAEATASDGHSVNLFQPSVEVIKGGNTLAKVGDQVTYNFTINNTSSADSPNLILASITDTLLGNLADGEAPAACNSLAPGASCNFSVNRTVQAGDPDPLLNTVSVLYHPNGFPNNITDSDDHSVNLFQPDFTVDKSGETLSKIGDQVTYDFAITNTSSSDSPNLTLVSISDDKLGNLAAQATAAGCDTLTFGETCNFSVNQVIPGGAADPYVDTVTVTYGVAGFANQISHQDGHSVNLFQPSVEIVKSGDPLSKVGDEVTYNFTINNTSSADSPNLAIVSITDTLLGNLAGDANAAGCDSLAPGASCNFSMNYTVQAGDPDPLVNTVTVHYNPVGFPNDIADSDDHSVNLFQPAVTVDKTGDELSKVGDEVTYSFTITNSGSSDSPNLILASITDTLLGNLADGEAPAACTSLAPGASCNFSVNRTVQAGDPDPLINTVSVLYHPNGFPNNITDSDDHSVNLFQPGVTVDKTGDATSKTGDTINYTITITNTSSADAPNLVLDSVADSVIGPLTTAANAAGCGTLGFGDSCVLNPTHVVQGSDPDPLVNVVTVHFHPAGFPNDISDTDDHSVNLVQPSVTIDKTGDALSKVGDAVDYTITVNNTSSSDSPSLSCVITDALLGISKNVVLAPGQQDVTHASRAVQAGDPDPLVNTASVTCTVQDLGNVLGPLTDTHSVNLFQPSVQIVKGGDPLSKVGDEVTYTFAITNTSSADSPNLILASITDTLLGNLADGEAPAACTSLAPGASCNFNVNRTVLAGDADPLPNVVTVHYNPSGFPNDISASDNHSVNLFQPGLTILKTCAPPTARVGDTITYTCTITNTSSADSPNLIRDSVTDTLLGDVTASFPASLAPGQSVQVQLTRQVQVGDPDPLVNTITAHYHPLGFPNDISATSSCTVDIIPGEGCTPGYWKTHPERWDGVGTDDFAQPDAAGFALAPYTTGDFFNAVFGVAPDESGLSNSVTLLQALNTGGGGRLALARHAAAALLNAAMADSQVDYPYTVNEVIDIYRDAVNASGAAPGGFVPINGDTWTVETALAALSTANELFCPLN